LKSNISKKRTLSREEVALVAFGVGLGVGICFTLRCLE